MLELQCVIEDSLSKQITVRVIRKGLAEPSCFGLRNLQHSSSPYVSFNQIEVSAPSNPFRSN